MLPAEKIPLRNKSEHKDIINYSGWYFWVTVLGSLAVLRIAGTLPAPHPATFQHVWVARCAAESALSVFLRCSHRQNLLLCLYNFRNRQMALRKTWGLQQVFEVLLPFLSLWVKFLGVKFLIAPASILPDFGPVFIAVSKASAVLGEQRMLLFDSLGCCCCHLPLCSKRFGDVAPNSSSLRCSC